LKIRLGGDWVRVEKSVASLLREVIAQAKPEPDSRLFPGRLRSDHLSVGGVQHHLREIAA